MTGRSNTGRDGPGPENGGHYLLFAGTQPPPGGGLGVPLDTFTSEEAARRAFRDVRLRMSSPTSWAQLAAVDDRQGLTPMCWFGIGAEPPRPPRTPTPPRDLPVIKMSAPQMTTAAAPRRQWLLVVAVLTLLSEVPVIAIGSTALIKVWATAAVLACALIIALVTRVQREARR